MNSGHVAGQNIKALQRTECKNVANSQSFAFLDFQPPSWTKHAILNLTKNYLSMKFVWSKYKPKTKFRMQKIELVEKPFLPF
jgi:hypothetical protein